MTDFFIADTHFAHNKVAQIRGYASTDEHDAQIIENIQSRVVSGDRLFVLGDISVGRPEDERYALEVFKSISDNTGVQLHLIAGNHDSCHPLHRSAFRIQRQFLSVFDSVQSQQVIKIIGERAALSHFPYDGDHTEVDRDVRWRLRDCGDTIIHGHTHSTEKLSQSALGTLQLCVSLDAWNHAPASKDELATLIKENRDG